MKIRVPKLGTVIRWGIAVVFVGLVTQATLTKAAPDPACMQKAATTRASELKTAYDDYAKEMIRISDKYTKEEHDAWKITGTSVQQDLARARTYYTNDLSEATRALSYKLQQAWNAYSGKLSSCGYASQSYQTIYGNNYGWYGGYGYSNRYYGYPYSYSSYGYPPYSTSYGGIYGGYGQQYLYGNTYGTGNTGYGYYNFGGQGYCPHVVMTALPAGCGYECRRDDRGCQTCEVSCRNVDTDNRPNCICPQTYAPVCGRDARTYTNSCYALCADTSILYGGACR